MSNSNLFGSLFGDGGLKTKPVETNVEDLTQFKPRFQKGQNERYEAIIRFLPNPEDPQNKSKIHKWTVFLKEPNSPQGKTIDSPQSINEPCPMNQMFFNLYNSKIESIKKLSKNWQRNERFYSLIQVIENQSEPSTVGKIMVWSYGKKIYDKIADEERPVMQGIEPNQPFDLFKGRLFKVVATKNGYGFNDLDGSKFFDIQYPANCMRMFLQSQDPNTGQMVTNTVVATRELAQTPEGQQQIVNYLETNAPKLSNYEYKPWDKETKEYVDKMILAYSQIADGQAYTPQQAAANVQQMAVNQSSTPMMAQTAPTQQTLTGVLGNIPTPQPVASTPNLGGLTGTLNPVAQPASIPSVASTPTPTQAAVGGLNVSLGLDSVSSAPSNPNPNMGGMAGVNVSNLNSIMESPVSTPQAAPVAGDITSILSGVMAN